MRIISDLERVKKLQEYELLDSLPEKEFDDIVELASAFFHTPISLISLLDSQRQWFKARVGLGAAETPIEYAFCYHAIKDPGAVFVVADSLQDERFKDNPLAIGEPHVRFYAGAPLVTGDGYALGTLCVIDNEPRSFTEEQEKVLRILARKVIERMDNRKRNIESKRLIESANSKLELTLKRLLEAERLAQIGNWTYDGSTDELYWSPEMYHLVGLDESKDITREEWRRMINPEDLAAFDKINKPDNELRSTEFRIDRLGEERWLLGRAIYTLDEGGHMQAKGTVMDITDRKRAEQNKEQYTLTLEETLFALSHKIRRPVANVIGMLNELVKDDIKEEERKQYVPYLRTSAQELDDYIHELNDFIHQKKITIDKK